MINQVINDKNEHVIVLEVKAVKGLISQFNHQKIKAQWILTES